MTWADLKIPPFRRQRKGQTRPPVIHPPDMELTGDQIREFAELQSKNPHFSAAQLTELRNAKTIAGAVKPDKTHGKLVGVMLGRYWYAS